MHDASYMRWQRQENWYSHRALQIEYPLCTNKVMSCRVVAMRWRQFETLDRLHRDSRVVSCLASRIGALSPMASQAVYNEKPDVACRTRCFQTVE